MVAHLLSILWAVSRCLVAEYWPSVVPSTCVLSRLWLFSTLHAMVESVHLSWQTPPVRNLFSVEVYKPWLPRTRYLSQPFDNVTMSVCWLVSRLSTSPPTCLCPFRLQVFPWIVTSSRTIWSPLARYPSVLEASCSLPSFVVSLQFYCYVWVLS